MQWIMAQADHIGGRTEQQDRTLILSAPTQQRHLLVLADGMGGHSGGALAAQAVIDSAQTLWATTGQGHTVPHPPGLLWQVCSSAHAAIQALGVRLNLDPHSTCVVLYLDGAQGWFSHLGDSRLYHFRGTQLQYRSKDHSLVQMLVDMGRVNEEDMGSHAEQGCLLKGLGGPQALELDYQQLFIQPGDRLLLCSDGFWERIRPAEMLAYMQRSDLAQALSELVALAVTRGGRNSDNVSVAVAVAVA